jgi:hypothetical protein
MGLDPLADPAPSRSVGSRDGRPTRQTHCVEDLGRFAYGEVFLEDSAEQVFQNDSGPDLFSLHCMLSPASCRNREFRAKMHGRGLQRLSQGGGPVQNAPLDRWKGYHVPTGQGPVER